MGNKKGIWWYVHTGTFVSYGSRSPFSNRVASDYHGSWSFLQKTKAHWDKTLQSRYITVLFIRVSLSLTVNCRSQEMQFGKASSSNRLSINNSILWPQWWKIWTEGRLYRGTVKSKVWFFWKKQLVENWENNITVQVCKCIAGVETFQFRSSVWALFRTTPYFLFRPKCKVFVLKVLKFAFFLHCACIIIYVYSYIGSRIVIHFF